MVGPPRVLFGADDGTITHPLVSLVMARSWEWRLPVGDECLRDSDCMVFFSPAY